MVDINRAFIASSIVLNILLAIVLYTVISSEEPSNPEIIFFERSEENKIEFDRDEVVRVATFNIRTFGVTKMGKPEVVSELVQIFDRYDMVTVQEIKDINQEVPYRFLDELKNESSEDWEMLLSERSGQQEDDIGGQEQYAVFYRNTAVVPSDDYMLYNDSELDEFYREPFLTEFTVLTKNGQISNLTFLMISIHTSPEVTVEELQSLSNLTMSFPESKRLIILGDMNADCNYASLNELDSLKIRNSNFTWIVPDDADTTFSSTRCAYDRIILDEQISSSYTGWWGIDREMSNSNVSDHFPIWFELLRPSSTLN
ncbi:MAG: hypothetical protein CMB31_05565 [Euryarchaeota archaeon]|nr:hypothetical protein [Euryarchaeota archaeon]|tara:strand:- start:22 stop:963 length:942 start_codon:yes stop_codon:yes gene_type:complete